MLNTPNLGRIKTGLTIGWKVHFALANEEVEALAYGLELRCKLLGGDLRERDVADLLL